MRELSEGLRRAGFSIHDRDMAFAVLRTYGYEPVERGEAIEWRHSLNGIDFRLTVSRSRYIITRSDAEGQFKAAKLLRVLADAGF